MFSSGRVRRHYRHLHPDVRRRRRPRPRLIRKDAAKRCRERQMSRHDGSHLAGPSDFDLLHRKRSQSGRRPCWCDWLASFPASRANILRVSTHSEASGYPACEAATFGGHICSPLVMEGIWVPPKRTHTHTHVHTETYPEVMGQQTGKCPPSPSRKHSSFVPSSQPYL